MHETAANTLREVLEKHHRTLSDELALLVDSGVQSAVEAERRKSAELFNQTLRRMRQAESQRAVLVAVESEAAAFGSRAVVLAVESGQARTIGEEQSAVTVEIDAAPALRAVVETKDPVVTLATAAELGSEVAALFTSSEGKAYLFPIAVRQEITAILIVAGGVAPAPPELLCEAAGMKLEALTAPTPVSTGLVQIAQPEIPASATSGPRAWDELSAEDQRLHLQAQRVARVKVAEMRLDHGDALRKGTFEGNIYGALRVQMDAARAAFLQSFLAKSATMVDYLHLEIMRSLAHDDDRLLGKEYPGPMV